MAAIEDCIAVSKPSWSVISASLHFVELGVCTAAAHEFLVRAALGDPAAVEDDDDVGGGNRREAVRDE
jgi:hypothetical protein